MSKRAKKRAPPRSVTPKRADAAKSPLHPYVVLAVAVVLPGVGQVLNNMASRGLLMVFFMISLGWVSYHLTTPEHSWVGRHAGGVFVYAMSLLDAYKWARVRWASYHHNGNLSHSR